MNYDKKILIIPDSNYLFVNFKSKADFREFSFNHNFIELVQIIEKNNLYDKCVIGLSEVVLEELLIQRIEAYNEQIDKMKQLAINYVFPHLSFDTASFSNFKYIDFLTKVRSEYLNTIKSKLIEFIDLPIPNQIRFTSIIRRAFEKRPPFEGVKGKSDKGFKDALLWESILDIKLSSDYSNVIVCTSDERMQNIELIKEFNDINKNINIEMVNPQALNMILNKLSSDNGNFNEGLNTLQEITEFLTSYPGWMMDIKLEDFLIDDDYIEYSVLNFEVLDYDSFSEDKFNALVELKFELVDSEKTKIIRSKKANIYLQYSNNEWFYIQYVFEGDQNV